MRLNWLRRWLKGKKSPQTNVRQDTKAKPQVLQLEDRLVPATLIVNTLADTLADDNQLSLREAIDAVNLQSNATLDAGAQAQITGAFGTGDTILFDAALAGGILTLGGTELFLQRSMTLDGEGLGLSIDGNQTSRIFNIDNLAPGAGITVNISNLTLFGGNATAGGNGGAIFNVENLNVFQVTFQNNRADSDGGALFTSTAGATNVSASLFVANTAAGIGGGAIYTAAGTLNIRNTTITGNHGNTVGGGIVSDGTTLTILNSTIVDNQVDSATGTGGGITVVSGVTTLLNSIVAGNFDGTATPQDLDSVNGVALSAASANNLIGDPATANGLAEGVNGNRIGDGANGVLPSSFIVLPLADNGGATLTHALTAGVNRARDAGNTTLATNAGLASDQRGAPFLRVFGSAVDLGAYEDQNIQFLVDHGGDNDDGNYSAGNLTLREAVRLANANPGLDFIAFDNVLANATITIGADLLITSNMAIGGLGADRLTLSGGGTSRIFFIDDGANDTIYVGIGDLTLTQGFNDTTSGGAIVNNESLSLYRVEVTNSTAPQGGGIANFGNLSITFSTLAGNNATADALLDTDGGAIYNVGELSVADSTLSGNRAQGFGSAIGNRGNATVISSTVVNNRADSDDDNSGGGALDNFGLNFILHNTIVAGNFAGPTFPNSDLSGTFTGQNNLIGNATSSGALTHGTDGNIIGANGTGTLDVNTILNTNLTLNGGSTRTHALVAGSAALNAGNNSLAAGLPTDQRGGIFQRIIGGTVDIGAFEAQTLNLVVDNIGDTDDGNHSPGNLTLREAVNLANANPGADAINFNTSLNNQTITLAAELPITDDVNINGLGADRLTISGNSTSRVFHVGDGVVGIGLNATISNLTLTRGDSALGGAILNRENLSLSFVEVTNSTAHLGGGIANSGNLTIAFSTLTGNNATQNDGGAILNDVSGRLTVLDSTLSNNWAADYGSAISALNANSTTIVHSTIVNNLANSNNIGPGDGALDRTGGTFVVQNSIVAGNFRGNGTTPSDFNGVFTGQNNIIGDVGTSGNLTHGVNGNIVGNNGTGTLDVNLILNTTLAYNGGSTRTHALVPGSLAINAGNTTLATNANLTTDQRGAGFPRVVGAVDIGAFEVQDSTPPTVVSVTSADPNGTYGLGNFILIEVNFSENVTVTGTPQLTLETGAADAVIDYLSGNGTSTLLFEYQVGTGHASADLDYTSISALTLNNGTIQDGAGNNANLTLPAPGANGSLGASKNLVVDGVVPTVTSIEDNDADNLVSVNVTQNYTVTMSSDIDSATVSAADFDNAGNATVSIGNVTYLGNGTFRVPVTPTSTGTVILRLHANATVADLAGNPLVVPVQDTDTVTATVNQPPVNVVPANQTVLAGQQMLLSIANGNSLSVNDDSANVSVNLLTTTGTFIFGINYGVSVSGYNSANMTINGTLANVQKTLDTLYFVAPAAPGAATVTITSNDGALTDQDTLSINVVASKANVPPTITAPNVNQTFTANTTFAFNAANNNTLQFGDIDSGVAPVVVNLKVNNGTLSLPVVVGLTFAGQGTNNLTLTGIIAHLNYDFAAGLNYTPTAGFTGNDVLQITINDQGHTGTGGALTASKSVNLIGPGGALDTTPPTLTSFEDNDADNVVSINSTINYTVTFNEAMNGTTITAADFNNNGTANITIGNVTQTGVGVYNVPVTPTSLGTITLRIPTGAVVQDVAGNNLTVPVQDGDTLTVTTNQPPVNTVPANQTVIAGTGTLFSVANNNSLSVTDDSANVSVNLATTNGLFTFAVNYGVGVTGYNSANMTLNGTLANVQKTLDTLFYIAPAATGSANVTITSSDGALQDVDAFTLTIVNPGDKVNAPPTITAPAGNQNVALGVPFAFANGNKIQVGDPDSGFNPVTVNLKVNSGSLNLGSTTGLTVQNNGAGNLTLTGRVDHLNYNLASLTYTANSTGNDTLAITINDLGNTGTGGAQTASQNVSLIGNGTVVVQNQAPVNTVPANATVLPSTYYLFSRGNQNAIQVADADLGAGNISVNLRTNAGFLAYAIDYGVTQTGYATNNLTISGPLANVNNTLDTMFFVAGNGATTDGQAPVIVVTTNDNGNTGPGGAKTDADTIPLTFEAANVHVNVPPTILSPVDTQIGSTIAFSFANNNAIQIGDKDAGVAPVQVTLQVGAGTLNVASAAIPGTTVVGRGTNTLILTGAVNLLNYYLQTLVYTMDALPNTDTLTIFVTDLANTGTGGQKTANANVAISRV